MVTRSGGRQIIRFREYCLIFRLEEDIKVVVAIVVEVRTTTTTEVNNSPTTTTMVNPQGIGHHAKSVGRLSM